MALTPQHVRNKLFTSVRLRQGYDEDEVDAFLDEVESELTRLLSEIEQRKGSQGPATDAQLAAVKADADARLQRMLDEAHEQHGREIASLQAEHAQAQQQAEAATRRAQAAGSEAARQHAGGGAAPMSEPSPGQLVPFSPTEDALRRTLVLAQRTADEAIAEARAEAQRIVTEAHRHAAESISRVEVEHSAIVQRRTAEQQGMLAKLDELRSFERDYRSRLRAYLHLQLRDLEAGAPEPPRAQVAGPTRQALAAGQPRPVAAAPDPAEPALRPPPLYGERPAEGGDG